MTGPYIQDPTHATGRYEPDNRSHAATLNGVNDEFRLEIPQIVRVFGQTCGHLAYSSGKFETVFLRPIVPSLKDISPSA